MQFQKTIIFVALSSAFLTATSQNLSQNPPNQPPGIRCVAAKDLVNTDLFGPWSLLLEGAGISQVTSLLLLRNPEFADSLAGSFTLGEKKFEVFGDIEEAAFDLEETDNGKDIRALWKGRVVEGSCGKTILGTRLSTVDNSEQNFVLRRPGW